MGSKWAPLASALLAEAGFDLGQRTDPAQRRVADPANDVEFFFLPNRDIACYVAQGAVDLGITARDLALDSGEPVRTIQALGFGHTMLRYAGPADADWQVRDLAGKRIATTYPRLVAAHLAQRGITADVIMINGKVEAAVVLGVADVVADGVVTGDTLRAHGLTPFGPPICTSQAVLVERAGAAASPARERFTRALLDVVFAQCVSTLLCDCHRDLLEVAREVCVGIAAPTVEPLADPDWVAVHTTVPHHAAGVLMGQLASAGARSVRLAQLVHRC